MIFYCIYFHPSLFFDFFSSISKLSTFFKVRSVIRNGGGFLEIFFTIFHIETSPLGDVQRGGRGRVKERTGERLVLRLKYFRDRSIQARCDVPMHHLHCSILSAILGLA